MLKVPKVLAEAAPKFCGTAFYTNGTGARVARPVYNFPKREAMLMAMSYSYELQAQVFDAWEAAEAALVKPAQNVLGVQSPKFLGDQKDAKGRTYKCYNFPKREAMLWKNTLV